MSGELLTIHSTGWLKGAYLPGSKVKKAPVLCLIHPAAGQSINPNELFQKTHW